MLALGLQIRLLLWLGVGEDMGEREGLGVCVVLGLMLGEELG